MIIKRLEIPEDIDTIQLDAISLVHSPAIEVNFMTFAKLELSGNNTLITDFDFTIYDPINNKITLLGKEIIDLIKTGKNIIIATHREDTQINRDIIKHITGISDDKLFLGQDAEGKANIVSKYPNAIFYDDTKENRDKVKELNPTAEVRIPSPEIKPEKMAALEDKQMVIGPALIPNKLILRKDTEGNYYYVYFDKQTVEQCFNIWMGKSQKYTLAHESALTDIEIRDNWLVMDPECDKSKALGFNNLPEGTWMSATYIKNKMLWEKIKQGEYNGWSIEGTFSEIFSKQMFASQTMSIEEYKTMRIKEIYMSSMDEELKVKKILKIVNE